MRTLCVRERTYGKSKDENISVKFRGKELFYLEEDTVVDLARAAVDGVLLVPPGAKEGG